MKKVKLLLVAILVSMFVVSCSKAPAPTFTKAETTKKAVVDSNSTAIVADENVSALGDLDDLGLLVDGNESAGIIESNTSSVETAKTPENNVSVVETAKVLENNTSTAKVAKKEILKVIPKKKQAAHSTTPFEKVKVDTATKSKSSEVVIENVTIKVENLNITTGTSASNGSKKIDFRMPEEKKNKGLVKAFTAYIPGGKDKNANITYKHNYYPVGNGGIEGCTVVSLGKGLAPANIRVSGAVKSANVTVISEAGKVCIEDKKAIIGTKYSLDFIITVSEKPKMEVLMKFDMTYLVSKENGEHFNIKKSSLFEIASLDTKKAPFLKK